MSTPGSKRYVRNKARQACYALLDINLNGDPEGDLFTSFGEDLTEGDRPEFVAEVQRCMERLFP